MAPREYRELNIDLLDPKSSDFLPKPAGVTVSLLGSAAGSGTTPGMACCCAIVIGKAAYDLGVNVLRDYVYQQIKTWNAKQVRINGREPKDDDELKRVIAEEIEIGEARLRDSSRG